MKKLELDLDLLLESFTLEKEGVCREYLDTQAGEIINIPLEVSEVIENCSEGEELEPWQKDLMEEAHAIYDDNNGRYLSIPTIKSDFSIKLVGDFVNDVIKERQTREEFEKVFVSDNSMSAFRSELFNHPNLLDLWHDYEEQRLKEHIIEWLHAFDIDVVQ
jgi:hypothetical protein